MRNRHHVLFPRAVHESTRIGKELRSQRLLIPTMDETIHSDLHNKISFIPMLNHHMGQRVLHLMEDSYPTSSIGAMKTYIGAVEESMKHPRTTDLDMALGHIVIESIDRQIPFVRNSNSLLKEIDSKRYTRAKVS